MKYSVRPGHRPDSNEYIMDNNVLFDSSLEKEYTN